MEKIFKQFDCTLTAHMFDKFMVIAVANILTKDSTNLLFAKFAKMSAHASLLEVIMH